MLQYRTTDVSPIDEKATPRTRGLAPRPATEEALRRLAAALTHADAKDKAAIAFTAAEFGEGTSTVALAVAELLADEFGQRVLLIPFRAASRLSRRYGVKPSRGLEAVLAGEAELRRAVEPIDKRFAVLPGLETGANKGAVAARFAEAIRPFRGEYERIVVDAPPVGRDVCGLLVARACDAAVLVVSAGNLPYEAVQRSRHLLVEEGVPLLGAVLNRRRPILPNWLYRVLR